MIRLIHENPDRITFPGLAEFRHRIESFVESANEPNSPIKVTIEPPESIDGEMGDPLTIILILKLIAAAATSGAALIGLVIKLRDLYVTFLAKRPQKSGATERSDKFLLEIKGKTLELPATDDEIIDFVNLNALKDG